MRVAEANYGLMGGPLADSRDSDSRASVCDFELTSALRMSHKLVVERWALGALLFTTISSIHSTWKQIDIGTHEEYKYDGVYKIKPE
jgi:hypothetical protein